MDKNEINTKLCAIIEMLDKSTSAPESVIYLALNDSIANFETIKNLLIASELATSSHSEMTITPHGRELAQKIRAFKKKDNHMKYTYTDFMDKKEHCTRRTFTGWQHGGILNVPGAVFVGKSSALWIPFYLLTDETLALLPPKPYTPAPERIGK